jgi:cephalosporin hydroxylase
LEDESQVGPIEKELDTPVVEYYLERVRIHMDDSYAGVRMRKFPEDLRILEELIWECRIDTVLEVGLGLGGSALWFRDRLRTLATYGHIATPLVISVDVRTGAAREAMSAADPQWTESIRLVEGDVCDPEVAARVYEHIPPGARVLVVDDSAHMYESTMATLTQFASLVPLHGYVVIEDGHRDLDGMLPAEVPGKAHGVLQAITDFLDGDGAGRFVPRRDLERYVVTSNPRGWLQRIS